ncbi:MAG: ComEC/Rec2 family competence protein [Rhizobiaceae bacterium]|nr:ComEC/Rec2 family competence protein [Rhizobiaceae bacterium]
MSASGRDDDGKLGGRLMSRRGAASALAQGRAQAVAAALSDVSLAGLAGWLHRQTVIETEARTGFFIAPAGLMIGIALVYAAEWRPSTVFAGAASALLLMMALRLREAAWAGPAFLLAGFVGAGAALSAAELARVQTVIFAGEATVRIEGRVTWRDTDDRGRIRYTVTIARTDRPVLSRPPDKARILVSSRHEPLEIGETYRGLVRLRPPSGPAFPGAYDFSFGSHFQGLGAYGFGLGAPEPPPQAGDASGKPTITDRFAALRLSIGERIREAIGGPEGAVAAALIMGDRAGIPDEIDTWLQTTGLSHVLSISGLHMALVAGFAMISVRALLAAFPWCALVLPIKKWAAFAALGVATFYLAISGGNVATDRSYIMLSIVLLAVLFDRPALTLRNLAIAAMVVLALSPHALTTASFQMSFAATAALLGAYGVYARRRDTANNAQGGRSPVVAALLFLAGLAATSLIAGTATAPYSAYHFQRIQPFGLIANLLAMPLFSVWIMPLALIAMLLMPFGLDEPFLVLMGYGLTLVFEIAHAVHDRLSDTPTGLVTATGLAFLSTALVLAAFLSSGLRWAALPIAAVGLALSPERGERPELLVFEDGKEVALIDASGTLVPLRTRPNDFVFSQWQRAFPPNGADGSAKTEASPTKAFTCRSIPAADPSTIAATTGGTDPSKTANSAPLRRRPEMRYCTATTRRGLTVAWTDDFRETGRACDEADVAIIARAIRLETCRSGATLVTLRTLRRTGSLAISKDPQGAGRHVARSIENARLEWTRHRQAPWPEVWSRSTEEGPPAARAQTNPDAARD